MKRCGEGTYQLAFPIMFQVQEVEYRLMLPPVVAILKITRGVCQLKRTADLPLNGGVAISGRVTGQKRVKYRKYFEMMMARCAVSARQGGFLQSRWEGRSQVMDFGGVELLTGTPLPSDP